MAESTIYVSGNPDLYPLEYYDSADKEFEGAIPEILKDFGKKNGYKIKYYEADGKDHREQHFKNTQTDMISGIGEGFRPDGPSITMFETEQGGKTISYSVAFTDSAPEEFREDLSQYMEGVSESEKTGVLMAVTSEERETRPVDKSVIGILAGLFAAACILVILLFRTRRKARRTEQKLRHDRVTGLEKREHLEKYFSQFVNDFNRIMYSVNYFYIDTERLARLAGQKEAEEAMRYAGTVLQEYVGDQDILAQVSQDGIVLLKLTGKDRESGAWLHIAVEKIQAYSEQSEKPHSIRAWAGVYPLRQSDRSLESIIENARMTARMASQDNVDLLVCSDDMLVRFQEEKLIEGDIERAFAEGEFQMFVQFYVETQSEKVCGAEALTRWKHPGKGLLAPGAFMYILERTGYISKLDYLMLEHACAFLERNFGKENKGFFLSCNFSRTSFTAPDFADQCKAIIDRYEFNKDLLTFELIESPDPGDAEQIKKNAEQMKEYGIRLALDDFGEGFTSFKDLLNYPIDVVKLDKSLTDSITGEKGKKIIQALIGAWHETSVKCLAEGVEKEEVLKILKEMSCDAVQGFMFYYPLPEREAERILSDMRKGHEI